MPLGALLKLIEKYRGELGISLDDLYECRIELEELDEEIYLAVHMADHILYVPFEESEPETLH